MPSRWPIAASTPCAAGSRPSRPGIGVGRDDPLYRARRVLLMGEEKLDAKATERLGSLLELGDPNAEVAIAYRIKERLRDFYRTRDPDEARQILEELKTPLPQTGHAARGPKARTNDPSTGSTRSATTTWPR